jgi:AcrR family transcriptional regulator
MHGAHDGSKGLSTENKMPRQKIVNTNWMHIKDLIRESGVARSMIHYYLREGLLPPPVKSGKTVALYTDVHLEILKFIRRLRDEYKMPIAGIRKEANLRFDKYWDSPEKQIATTREKQGATKGEKQKARILDKAMYLFSVKGYHSTHISHITDALNISKATFYLYFVNKEDLFINIFEHLALEMTKTEEKISGIDDLVERARERARAYFTFYKKYYRIFEIIRAESIGKENLTRVNIRAIYKFLIDKLMPDIIKAADTGMIPIAKKDPQLLAHVMFGALDFICYARLIDLGSHSVDEYVEFFETLLFNPGFKGNHGS